MTEHLFKIANAFQAAKEDGDGSSVNVRRLARNLSDFSKHMEEAVNLGTADEAHLKQRAVLAALISCPRVRKEVQEQPALAPLLKTVPVLQDCTLSMIVRPLSCQSAVLPVLAHLPLHLLCYLMKKELQNITKAVSPPLLSLVVEFSKTLLNMLRSSKCTDEAKEVLVLLVPVFKIAMHNFDNNVPKNAAFTFLLFLESLYQFSRFILNDTPDELPISHVPELQNAFPKRETENTIFFSSSVMDTTVSLLKMCHESVHKIDVNTWMSWAEVKPTDAVYCSRISQTDTETQLTVQSLITHQAFLFLNLFNFESVEVFVNGSSSSLDEARRELHSNLMQHSELHGFLKQIASDPDYDPDSELGFSEVVSFLQRELCDKNTSGAFLQNNDQTSALTQKRLQKLSKLLLEESDPNQLFNCVGAAGIVSRLATSLLVEQARQLLQNFLEHAAGNGTTLKLWNEAVLAVCRPLLGTEVRRAVLTELRRDNGDCCCRDWLTSDGYYPNLTSLCNTMAHDQGTSNHSLLADGGLWWVSVQRPRSTVSALVQQSVSVSGMAVVTARAVRQLAPLCTARYANEKLSILSEALKPFLTDVRTFNKPKHRIAFVEFFSSLFEGHHSTSPGQEEEVVLVEEVLRELLLPTLQWRGPADLDSLEVPLALLQVLLQHRRDEVMRCCWPGADTASLVLTLLSIVHNCHCLLATPPLSNPQAAANTTILPVNGEVLQSASIDQSIPRSVDDECYSPSPADLDQERNIHCPTEGSELSDSISSNSPGPSSEASPGPGASQCLELLCQSRDVLRRVVKEISKGNHHRQSIFLVRRYLNGNSLPLSVSCIGLLHPLLKDPIQATRSEFNSSEAASDTSRTRTPLGEVCSSRAVTVMRLMSTITTLRSETDDTFGGEEAATLLHGTRDWPYEQWVISLVQSADVADAPVPALAVLRDVLQLVTRTAETGLPLNTTLCYRHCTAAATRVVKQRCSGVSWRERLSLVTRVFVWWCTNHVAAQDEDLPCLLLLRLAEMVREVAVVVGISDQPRSTPDLDGKTAKRRTSIDRNGQKNVGGLPVASDELLARQNSDIRSDGAYGPKAGAVQNNNTDVIINGASQGLGKSSPKNKLHNTVSLIEFRAMVGSLIDPFLKYSSGGTLSQTIATRLLTLLE